MNAKLLFKTIFLMLILLLLVMMGMNNKSPVSFALPPILQKAVTQPAALMYFGFFAVGVITGTVLTAGRSGSGASAPSKPAKSGK
ncbi:MAG: hypothetical protein EXS31_11510 [Pedosphaera sp.]|nr:hypothetical protein [Pedosphaera sp.]